MNPRRPSRRVLRSLCGEVGPGDGIDPRLAQSGSTPSRAGRKTRQLCAQASDALSLALADTGGDAEMAGLVVIGVEPAPDSSRLLVTVAPPEGEHPDPSDLLARLDRAAPRLRAEVARSITRRRAPALSFRVLVR